MGSNNDDTQNADKIRQVNEMQIQLKSTKQLNFFTCTEATH